MVHIHQLLFIALLLRVGFAQNSPPIFDGVVDSVTILEQTSETPDLEIYVVSATDPDGDNVTYLIPTNSQNSQYFKVDNETGQIFTRQGVIIDREVLSPNNNPLYLFIEAQDGLVHEEYVQFQLIIVIEDMNDNHPRITANLQSSYTVPEDTLGGIIETVEATDADSGGNALVFFSLQEESDLFSLERQTGVLRLTGLLDYDDPDNRRHSITIIAEDNGDPVLRDSETIMVIVSDVDDLDPVFEPSSYFKSISENTTFGEVVETVMARDGDTGINAEIFYILNNTGNSLINGQNSFVIDSVSGKITVNVSKLDREIHSSYMLTVQALQVNDTSKVATTTVHLTILDINDNQPIFEPAYYAANVSEDEEIGYTIQTVSVTDKDHGTNAEFQLRLENLINSSSDLPFGISLSGNIILEDILDFEDIEYYLIRVIAEEESGANGTALIRIDIENRNDVDPVFEPDYYYVNISEGVAADAFIEQILADDGDSGIFGEITYSLFSGHFDDFYINTTSGAVFTGRILDYEDRSSYTIIIQANDTPEEGMPSRIARTPAELIVDVININDNPPVFVPRQQTVELNEELDEGTVVVILTVSDDDGDELTDRMFHITNGNDLGNFTFDPDSENVIVTSMRLDYDLNPELREQVLTIVVNDTLFTDEATITIQLIDINDNTPKFQNDTYQFEVCENVGSGTVVDSVFAEDADSDDLGLVKYSISTNDKFTINESTGQITTKDSLDREQQNSYIVTITATDQDPNTLARRSQAVQATITVLDVNDNDPEFIPDSDYDVSFTENTDIIEFSVEATDIDIGTNSEITYEIINGSINNAFVIGPDNGMMIRNASVTLDREEVASYFITVLATDNGDPSNNATATITVTILDVNDEQPVFLPSSYNQSIDEDIRDGSIVLRVTATDKDTAPNAMIQYSLISIAGPDTIFDDPATPSGTFVIDEFLGDITTQGLFDREAFQGPYVLQVLAVDNGIGISLSGSAEISIYLTDVNDNDPIFQPSTYSTTIDEELPAGQSVAMVIATDRDAGSNEDLSYSISSVVALNNIDNQTIVATHFSVNTTSGLVVTNVPLNYEFVQRYRITVTATDNGDNQRSSSATIIVTVSDINDHTPQFSNNLYIHYIPENILRNTRISLLEVTDEDSGDNSKLTFIINMTSPFSIDSETGDIIVTYTLDYETNTNYSFTVYVTDNGMDVVRMNSTEVFILLEDVNDNPPIFLNDSYFTTIPENDYTSSYSILEVVATDLDSRIFGQVSYSLLPENNAVFSLDNITGELSVIAEIDFESLDYPLDATQTDIELIIQASDGGTPSMTSTVTVTIIITDENDNSPIFQDTPYITSLRENSSPGVEVIVVQATDADGNSNGVVRYSIIDSENFSIDDVTGVITTGISSDLPNSTLFDYESQQKVYIITVYATDNGTIARRTEVNVTVNITDINDNNPTIISVDPQTLLLFESASTNTLLGVTIIVNDEDSNENGEVEYTLSNDGGLFAVSSSGEISLIGSLDRETVEQYNISIIATDQGQPQRSDESYLLITVRDVNDNAPSFEQDTYTSVLMEDVDDDVIVISLRVRDIDSRDSGGGNLIFMIRSEKCEDGTNTNAFTYEETEMANGWWILDIKTRGIAFDYENGCRSYDLIVEAQDQATPIMLDTANITITIVDVNDNSPLFSSPSYILSLPEDLPPGGAVGSVLATDPDGANYGTITYMFDVNTSTTITNTFSIHPETGVFTLEVPINFENGTMVYEFIVVAMDGDTFNPRSSNANVRINVQDINEFAPRFTQNLYNKTVPENQGQTVVLTVSASDSEAQGTIIYGIVTGSTTDFTLDAMTGVLTTSGPLDREAVPQYILTLEAVDDIGINARTSYTQVLVTVGDVNDVTPEYPLESYTYSIPENFPSLSSLTPSPIAVDTDLGSNAELLYFLQPPTSFEQPFRVVDSSTGIVTLDGTLDRETLSTYTLTLLAVDQGIQQRRTGSTELRITVTDVNDRAPVFDTATYSVNVLENSPDGVSVVTIHATDEDTTDILLYDIIDGNSGNHFQIDYISGLISTTVISLDREMMNMYTLTVTVTDDLRTDTSVVVITVDDVNDNSPIFSSDIYSTSHDEDNNMNLVVAVVTATDRDAGANGEIEYHFTGGNSNGIFYIDSSSGEVIARARMLDYEMEQVHTLTIEATDQATPTNLQQFSTAVVTVVIRDTNDNRPTFSQNEYYTTVIENVALGTTIAVITATDGDSGTNGEIVYSFGTTSSSLFAISSTNGVVTVTGNINFEMGQDHELSVEARDRGNPQRSQVVSLYIQVINAEDESPRFPISFYTADVDEDVVSPTSVLTVTATDPDGSDSLVYDIVSSSNIVGGSYFSIIPQTGEIITAGDLDRETVAVVDLLVIATDTAGHNGTAIVQITIGDVNDNAPEFNAVSYTASLRENSAVGTTIIPFSGGNSTRVEARDIDGPGLNSEVSYDKEGEDSDKFSVDKDTGIVTVAPGAVLDREEDEFLELTITAEDHGIPERTARVTMTITLLDENDNRPTFIPQFGYAVVVQEDKAVGSILMTAEAMDPDLLGGGDLSFRTITSSPLNKLSCFSINSTTGAITLEDSLDREENPLISLIISAHDSGVPSLVTSTTVQITVTDVNDNIPVFSQNTYIATVSEQHTVGGSVVMVFADDPDSGTNGQVEYSVTNSNTPFIINPDTGEISTQLILDYELQRKHDIIVQACDKGEGSNCSTAAVTIYVTDFNDERPVFDFTTYRTDICHTQPPSIVIMQPVATDRDSGANSDITYSLDDVSMMEVSPDNGSIHLVMGVVSEDVESEFTAIITANDGGNPMLSGTARVIIRVLNCSQTPFRFESPFYEAEVYEGTDPSGMILHSNINTLFPAVGTGITVEFSPELSNNPFSLVGRILTIEDQSLVDREKQPLYTLPIISMTNDAIAHATITVTVRDVNDNIPQLQLSALSFTVSESMPPPLHVTTAVATDDDIGEHATISFSFTVTNNYFNIDESTGVVTTTTELDREELSQHQLSIQASDGEFPSQPIIITVTVSDRNDNPPIFSDDIYSVSVPENYPTGTSVLTVMATDKDIGENAVISFHIVDGDINIFSLNSETGVIQTTAELNFEAETQYSLTINASDNGAPVLQSSVYINITILDFNDHTPTFLNPVTMVTISEGVPIGTILTDFNVTDVDSGDRGLRGVRFTIVAGNTDLFSINSVSGILKTEALLDRDMDTACYFLSIQATDSAGENSLSDVTEIEVCVSDENDNCPIFIQPTFSGEIPEDENINQQLLLRVQATDADSDTSTNGAIVYSLLEDGGVFDIDPSTGYLSLTSTLDTETIPSYELVVVACDRGNEQCCTNTTISVDVIDVNDNKPVINNVDTDECVAVLETNDTYSCAGIVQEIGDVIFTVNATDVDTGLSGAVTYRFAVDSSLFSISSGLGVITIAGDLDYEIQQTYQLYINAIDQGVPLSLPSEIRILCINIVDINDKIPQFSVNEYSVSQDEGPISQPSVPLLHIVAIDGDSGDNAIVTYSISSGNTTIFRINEESGQLYLAEELDCETTNTYTLTITANNSLSTCPLSSTVDVVVMVIDINDNPPVLSQDVYVATVPENVGISHSLLDIDATDADKDSPNNDLLYRLVLGSGPNPFHLDQNDGILTVQNALDAESLPDLSYNLTVVVEDKAENVMSDSATVVIYVTDVNDEPAIFNEDVYIVEVMEEDSTLPLLLSLTYNDNDMLLENRDSIVTIINITGHNINDDDDEEINILETGSQLFSINENNTLQLLQALDRETIESYSIMVAVDNKAECNATDGDCSSKAEVVVMVTDINDNAPQFTKRTYSGEVSVTASPGTSVLTVEAIDIDEGNNGKVRYVLEDTLNGRFRIDEVTGEIETRGSFANLDGQRLTLTVKGYDNPDDSQQSLTSTAIVNIVVLNDFQRISILFSCGIDIILQAEDEIISIIANVSGLDIQVENYVIHSNDISSNFIFHATDPVTNEIVDFDEFFAGDESNEAELISRLSEICPVERITAFANIEDYLYPDALDTQTIVIFILCIILAVGAITSIAMAIRQRWVALHDTRSKLLADVFYGSPGSTSLIENVHHENIQLETMETGNRQNPMFVQPYDNWQGIDASGPESTGDISSMNRDNPLYESQEIRMEMFADVSDEEEEGDEADDAELLAAALREDEEPEDNSVTAI